MTNTIITANDAKTIIKATSGDTVLMYDFNLTDSDDLRVQRVNADGTRTDLRIGIDYNIQMNALSTGGSITLKSPSEEATYILFREVPYARTTLFTTEDLNRELNVMEQQIQQNRRDLDRSFLLPLEYDGDVSLFPTPENGMVLGWDGTKLVNHEVILANSTNFIDMNDFNNYTDSINGTITSIQRNIASNVSSISAIQAAQNQLSTRIGLNETEISGLMTSITALQTALANKADESRVQALQDNLQAQITQLVGTHGNPITRITWDENTDTLSVAFGDGEKIDVQIPLPEGINYQILATSNYSTTTGNLTLNQTGNSQVIKVPTIASGEVSGTNIVLDVVGGNDIMIDVSSLISAADSDTNIHIETGSYVKEDDTSRFIRLGYNTTASRQPLEIPLNALYTEISGNFATNIEIRDGRLHILNANNGSLGSIAFPMPDNTAGLDEAQLAVFGNNALMTSATTNITIASADQNFRLDTDDETSTRTITFDIGTVASGETANARIVFTAQPHHTDGFAPRTSLAIDGTPLGILGAEYNDIPHTFTTGGQHTITFTIEGQGDSFDISRLAISLHDVGVWYEEAVSLINAVVDAKNYATEAYVRGQIAQINIPDPADLSNYITQTQFEAVETELDGVSSNVSENTNQITSLFGAVAALQNANNDKTFEVPANATSFVADFPLELLGSASFNSGEMYVEWDRANEENQTRRVYATTGAPHNSYVLYEHPGGGQQAVNSQANVLSILVDITNDPAPRVLDNRASLRFTVAETDHNETATNASNDLVFTLDVNDTGYNQVVSAGLGGAFGTAMIRVRRFDVNGRAAYEISAEHDDTNNRAVKLIIRSLSWTFTRDNTGLRDRRDVSEAARGIGKDANGRYNYSHDHLSLTAGEIEGNVTTYNIAPDSRLPNATLVHPGLAYNISAVATSGGGVSFPAGAKEGQVITYESGAIIWADPAGSALPTGAQEGQVLTYKSDEASWETPQVIPTISEGTGIDIGTQGSTITIGTDDSVVLYTTGGDPTTDMIIKADWIWQGGGNVADNGAPNIFLGHELTHDATIDNFSRIDSEAFNVLNADGTKSPLIPIDISTQIERDSFKLTVNGSNAFFTPLESINIEKKPNLYFFYFNHLFRMSQNTGDSEPIRTYDSSAFPAGFFPRASVYDVGNSIIYISDSQSTTAGNRFYSLTLTSDTITRIGTLDNFGVSETRAVSLEIANGVLYMLGRTTNALYSVNTTTGQATRIGSATNFGVGEDRPSNLFYYRDQMYMIGSRTNSIYTLNLTTGVATLVSALTLPSGFIMHDVVVSEDELYAIIDSGEVSDQIEFLVKLDIETGGFEVIQTPDNFGVDDSIFFSGIGFTLNSMFSIPNGANDYSVISNGNLHDLTDGEVLGWNATKNAIIGVSVSGGGELPDNLYNTDNLVAGTGINFEAVGTTGVTRITTNNVIGSFDAWATQTQSIFDNFDENIVGNESLNVPVYRVFERSSSAYVERQFADLTDYALSSALESYYTKDEANNRFSGGSGAPQTLAINPEGALHLGRAGNEADSVSGLLSVNSFPLPSNIETTIALRFDNTLEESHIPEGGSYNGTTGAITLPAGDWIICATARLTNIDTDASAGNSRIFGTLEMRVGGRPRHAQSMYIRSSQNTRGSAELANEWVNTISGSYESTGTEVLSIAASLEAQTASRVSIDQVHIHAYRQVVNQELTFTASDGADGVSPSASVEKNGSTATFTIIDATQTSTTTIADGSDGNDGTNGTSAFISAEKQNGVATIITTDANATTTTTISDGAQGEQGDPATARAVYSVFLYGSQTNADFNVNGMPSLPPSTTTYDASTGLFARHGDEWRNGFFNSNPMADTHYWRTWTTYNVSTSTLGTWATPEQIDPRTGSPIVNEFEPESAGEEGNVLGRTATGYNWIAPPSGGGMGGLRFIERRVDRETENTLYGLETDGTLYTINTTTGQTTRLGDLNPRPGSLLLSMTTHNGLVYIASNAGLYTADLNARTTNRIGSSDGFGVGETNPTGLASHNGVLYMAGQTTGNLHSVDTTTGIATRIGTATNFGVSGSVGGLESFNGNLYIFTTFDLRTIDTTTGIASASIGRASIQGFELFTDGSNLYFGSPITKRFYIIDVSDASSTAIGTSSYSANGLQAISFVERVISEDISMVFESNNVRSAFFDGDTPVASIQHNAIISSSGIIIES